MDLTSSQKLAVSLEGNSVLVSAAAGSGKTSVLSLRVIRKLTDPQNHCDADRLMILTYTKAAAAEMRERITASLREMLANDPQNKLVRRQLLLLPGAKIGTIHSACLDIIRSNFQSLDIDPQFTIAEENKLSLMKTEALDDFAEQIYERAETDTDIRELIEYFTRGRDDGALMRAIDSASEFLLKQPYPEMFVKSAGADSEDCVFGILPNDALYRTLTDSLQAIVSNYQRLTASVCRYPKLCEFYDSECSDIAVILKAVTDRDYDRAVKAASELKFKTHPRRSKDSLDWDIYSDYRKALKTRTQELIGHFLYANSELVLCDRKGEQKVISTLLSLCIEFNDILFNARKKQRLMSFGDIEKYTLDLLIDNSDGKLEKTPLAAELSLQIDEIIVDEFQDCNLTQDLIFNALSDNSKNIFMVGDVKQSIYRFRGAQPDIFIQKQKTSVPVTDEGLKDVPMRVDLSCNFRSDKKILNFVNTVFDVLMVPSRGGIDYIDGHRLTARPDAADDTYSSVCLDVIVAGADSKDARLKANKTVAEAEHVAQRIYDLVSEGTLITDTGSGTVRPLRYDDIAILMRAPKTDGAIYESALSKKGIGCINNNPSENYLDTPEVKTVLAFLQAIDNPYEDIPLVTLMYSDFFGFTANELGDIRAKNRYMLFFDAVKDYAKTNEKAQDFICTLEYLRNLSLTTDVYGIISAVYEKSGILLRLSSKPDGDIAKANLMMLLDYASKFESSRYRGLFAFINYIGKLIEKKDSIPAARLKKSGNCVGILSIHGSKGLEYPVVFVVGSANIISSVKKDDILLSSVLGAGGYTRDSVSHRDFSSLSRNVISAVESDEELNESLRLLYVALTRAKNRLYITASVDVAELEKTVNEVCISNGRPNKFDFSERPSYLKWILFTQTDTPLFGKLCAFAGVSFAGAEMSDAAELFITDVKPCEQDPSDTVPQHETVFTDKARAMSLMTRVYAFEQSTRIPAKLSVSDIKGMQSKTGAKSISFKKPRFMQNGISGTDRGNATHSFLQFCDFSAVTDKKTLADQKEYIVKNEFITAHDCSLVDDDGILGFICSDIMQSLIKSGTCRKEDRFLFTLPADEVLDTDSKEPVVIQGIIDCWFEKDGGAVIVDYKTDNVKDADTLIKRYKVQLDMYEKAIMNIHGMPTHLKYIYSFCLKKFIKV